jgi:large subunit ribosomal protein L5
MNRLKKHFEHVTRHDLIIKDHLINSMQVPYLNKLVLNIGLGSKLILNRKEIVTSLLALELISSQRASMTRARKSIDKFKLKKRMVIGSKVTLRKKKMFFFLDKLITEVLPNLENLEEFNKNYKRSLNQNIKKNKTHRQRLGLRKNKS